MICDPLTIVSDHGISAESFTLIVDKDDHLVAKIETNQGAILLKADTAPGHTKRDAVHNQVLAVAGFPVQTIIAQSETPISHILLTWIDGHPLSAESPLEAQIEAGEMLHRIHHLTDAPAYDRPYTWDEWMEGWLNAALPWWGQQDGVSSQMIDGVWHGFKELRPLLATRGHHYMLFDGRPEHFLVKENRIVGLIDLENAQGGDAGMDFGVIGVLDEALLKNMRKGYSETVEESDVLEQLIPFYIFLRRLAAADWNYRHDAPKIADRALALANTNPFTFLKR